MATVQEHTMTLFYFSSSPLRPKTEDSNPSLWLGGWIDYLAFFRII